MEHITVRDLMTEHIIRVSKNTSIVELAKMLSDQQHSCAIVEAPPYESDGPSPLGIVTERDIVRALADLVALGDMQSFCTADIMSSPVRTLNTDASLYEALAMTQSRGIRHIPVVDDHGAVCGLVTQTELARSHFRLLDQQRETIEQNIRDRTAQLAQRSSALGALALQDDLLGIGNRRAWEVDAYVNHIGSVRTRRPYALVLLEVDDFDTYQSQYGEDAAKVALREVNKIIKEALRTGDRHYRYSHDRFALLMPETSRFEVVEAMSRLVENMELQNIAFTQGDFQHLTVSVGIGICDSEGDVAWQSIMEDATNQLSQAKALGCNQTCFAVDDIHLETPTKNPLKLLIGGHH